MKSRNGFGPRGGTLRKLGIVGGASWSSTALYYDHINRGIARELGGLHSARLIVESFDFQEYAAFHGTENSAGGNGMVVDAAMRLAGAVTSLVLLVERLGGQAIANRPLLLLAVLLVALGVQLMGLGLVGEIIVHLRAPHRRAYRVREQV